MDNDDVIKLARLAALLDIHDAGQLMDVGLFLSQQPRTVLTCRPADTKGNNKKARSVIRQD